MLNFCISTAAAMVFLCAPQVQLGDGISLLAPNDAPTTGRTTIYSARGESENVWLSLQNDDIVRRFATCELALDGTGGVTAQLFVIRDPDRGLLEPLGPQTLAPQARLLLLVRLYTPPSMPPGRYEVAMSLHFEEAPSVETGFDLEVFDFALPQRPGLPVVLGVDREAFHDACGVTTALRDWQPLYDAVSEARMGMQVWPAPGDPDIFYDYSNMEQVKAHLAYAAGLESTPALEIGGETGGLLEAWPAPVLDSPQDPLQYLLFSTMATLEDTGWDRPTILIPSALPKRDAWQAVRDAYARVSRADARITRLLTAPAHPFFERYTDIWALPPDTPYPVMEALQSGRSLITYEPMKFAAIRGSDAAESAPFQFETVPADAFDGAEASAWQAAAAAEDKPWLEVIFRERQHLETITIIWAGNEPGIPPRVDTTYNTDVFSLATVDWDRRYTTTASGAVASMGSFKYPRECLAVKFSFDGRPAIAEILFNTDIRRREGRIQRSIDPVTPWLDGRTGEWGLSATLLRAVPWYCWQAGFQGVLGPILRPEPSPLPLVTCDGGAMKSAVALFALADGIEDYDYLQRYLSALAQDKIDAPSDFQPGFPLRMTAPSNPEEEAQIRATIQEQRLTIGRLLSGQRLVTRNFGPRRR